MAEERAWGYEDVEIDHAEALRLFRQAANLGISDAYIRIGQLQEHGKGTRSDPKAALKSYQSAAKAGNFFALAHAAKLLSRSPRLDDADALWSRFFESLIARPDPGFASSSCGELLHGYIVTQLRLGLEPGYKPTLSRYRIEIAGHHQRLLEHALDSALDRLDGVSAWIELNLGPWP